MKKNVMSVCVTNQLEEDRHSILANYAKSRVLVTSLASKVSGMITLSIGTMIVVGTIQVVVIGLLDVFGIAPQYSFIGFNITLITVALAYTVSSVAAPISRLRRSSSVGAETGAETNSGRVATNQEIDPIGKILFIRRVFAADQNIEHLTSEISEENREAHAIAATSPI